EVIKEHHELGLSGLPYELTPSGLRMIEAKTVQEQQECMLRALLAYEIPSAIESKNGDKPFKPFVFILQVLKKLETLEKPLGLSPVEMGIVQSYRDHNQVELVIEDIIKHRTERSKAVGRVAKRKVDKELLKQLGIVGGVQSSSIRDYADVNFRYPRLTGLVSHKGKRLIISEKKSPVVDSILVEGPKTFAAVDRHTDYLLNLWKGAELHIDNGNQFIISEKKSLVVVSILVEVPKTFAAVDRHTDYLLNLWKGAELPTDNEMTAKQEINRFRQLLLDNDVDESLITTIPDTDDVAILNQTRIRLEVLYQQVLEKQYAMEQTKDEQVKETIAYLKKLDKQPVEEDIEIEDEPAYLEWAVWRAFLTINHIVNEPHEARRFKVDQDFLPMGCAPGGGPDLIFEFEDYVLVVEVTLTTSSRQEAAEGEPVRRHVAKEKTKVAEKTGKPVYGLFMARSIDNNTAETFRIGVWYNGDEP